jgi:hypothetical protein
LILLATAVIFWMSGEYLSISDLRAGLKLAAIILAYMICVHVGSGLTSARFLKELAVGIMFAAGAALPSWSGGAGLSREAWIAMGFFAVLCSLNCLTIECGENKLPAPWPASSPLLWWVDSRLPYLAALLAAAAFAAAIAPRLSRRFSVSLMAVSLGALLLLLLNFSRKRLSSSALRVLADVALVAPAAIALLVNRP